MSIGESGTAQPARSMAPESSDRYLSDMIDHAVAWMPFGGADDQIFVEFGTAPATFYRRILSELERPELLSRVPSQHRDDLHAFCRYKVRVLRSVGLSPPRRPGPPRRG
ncbi:hypothetical protein D7316_03967 [Gordonia insulae]|uniref:DUF3263 domain-containing protein n=1 Tax=Gordonia insulae TaxID=2420509 RepID=A0A3G8JR14_9ACTN|nr:hypothetical protein D7316_03967 [Gordonia insulae]